jgi:hypothetical protein
MDALQEYNVPSFRGILFRKTFPRLGEVIDRSFKYFKPIAQFSSKDQKLGLPAWTFPSGAKLAFSHLQHETSKYDHQGKQYSWIGFDQLEEFTESQYLYLMAQNRTDDPKLDCRIRSSANPGGIGHLWVKNRFIDKLKDGEMKYFKRVNDEDIECKEGDPLALSRAFYFSTVYDNPALMQNNPTYIKQLEQLPETERKALLHGDWNVFAGQFFSSWRNNLHVKERAVLPEFVKFIGLDYGYAKQSAAIWVCSDYDGRLHVYRELYQAGLTYEQLARMVMEMTPDNETIQYISADPAIWGDRSHHRDSDEGESGGETLQRAMSHFTVVRKGDNDRMNGWARVREYLEPKASEFGARPMLTFSPSCRHCIRTIPALIHDESRPEDCNSDGEDHLADSLRYALLSRPLPTRRNTEVEVKMFSPEWYLKQKKNAELVGYQADRG